MIYMDQKKVGGYGELYQMSKDGTIKSSTIAQAETQMWPTADS